MPAGGISVHAVDVARGRVAEGLAVRIDRLLPDGGRVTIAEGQIGPDGMMDHPVVQGAGVAEGEHEVLMAVGDFLTATGSEAPSFLGVVPFRFRVFDVAQHYHLPIKFTPFGFSLFRGAEGAAEKAQVPGAEPLRRRFYFKRLGNMGNAMLQLIIARGLIDRLGPAEFASADPRFMDSIASWPIEIASVRGLPPGTIQIAGRVNSLDDLAARIAASGATDVSIETLHIGADDFPPLDQLRELFPAKPALDCPPIAEDELVISVRGDEILRGKHRDYVVPPPGFYRDLVERTGLRPVFIGQIGDNAYCNLLRERFPDARFLPSISAEVDFGTLRRARHIVPSVSSFATLAARLSMAEQIYLPLIGVLNPFQRRDARNCPLKDPRYRFFLFPLFHMTTFEEVQTNFEARLSGWEEVSPTRLAEMIATSPRLRPTLEQSLAVFEEADYLRLYGKVAQAVAAGKLARGRDHFEAQGYTAGLDPLIVDTNWYGGRYPDAARAVGRGDFLSLAQHYAAVGHELGYLPRPPAPQAGA